MAACSSFHAVRCDAVCMHDLTARWALQVYNNLLAVSLPATFDPQPSGDGTAWAAASRNALVEALGTGARSVDFDARDFNEFFEAYRNPDTRTKKRVRTYHGDQPAGAAVGRTDKKKQ